MKSLRIVLVMPDLPLPFGNASGRWYYVLLKGLVEDGHRLTALAVGSHGKEFEEARHLFPSPEYDLRLFPRPGDKGILNKWNSLRRPHSCLYGRDLQQELDRELSRGFDVLHLEHHWTGWLGLPYAERAVLHVKYLFEIDLADTPTRSLLESGRRWLTIRAEHRLIRHYPTLSSNTPRLSERLKQINPAALVSTVPTGIDLSLYPFKEELGAGQPPVVGLIGSFDWQPTYSAGIRLLTRLWPEIKRRLPEARLQIVGRNARTALRDFLGLPDVAIYEDVADTRPYFLSTAVLLYAPGRGSGLKVKVLEAFAQGIPTVTTAAGVEGLPALDGVHAGICEDDQGLIERTLVLLGDRQRQESQRQEARRLVESHCSPRATVSCMEQVYDAVTLRSGRTAASSGRRSGMPLGRG